MISRQSFLTIGWLKESNMLHQNLARADTFLTILFILAMFILVIVLLVLLVMLRSEQARKAGRRGMQDGSSMGQFLAWLR